MKATNFTIIFALQIAFFSNVHAQQCKETADLLNDEGSYIPAIKTPLGGFVSDFKATEKAAALKTLNLLEADIKKLCNIKGGVAQAFFSFKEPYYFDKYPYKTYEYNIGFYQDVCVNGKKIHGTEYGTLFSVKANPTINPFFYVPHDLYRLPFEVPGTNGHLTIPLFRFLVFENDAELENIKSGEGYYEDDKGNIYDKQKDIFRTWYIYPKSKKLMVEVSRKEYLNSLLEFYDREYKASSSKCNNTIAEAGKYMAEYQKSGNKAMYQSHLENKQQAEKELEKLVFKKDTKTAMVQKLLQSKPEDWLMQAAKINPNIRSNNFCESYNDFDKTGYFSFRDFCETGEGKTVYKWNPGFFKEQAKSPATPLFFKVTFRYHDNTPFSYNIREGFVKNVDFEAIKKLLSKN